jgi:signal transduction histidine kinase
MRKSVVKTIVALSIAATFSAAYANDKDTAVSLVNDAAKGVTANKSEGVKNIQNGVYSKGELYTFAYDLNGVLVAHPQKVKDVGQNFLAVPDETGKMFRKDIVETAKSKAGSGWVDYTIKGSAKSAFCKKVVDIAVCSAIVK